MTGRLRELTVRLLGLLRLRRRDDPLEELRFHREMLQADLEQQGLSREAARAEASRRMGGEIQAIETWRDQTTLPSVESFVQDVRYAFRTFRRAPAFAAAALLTLALGIGATTAIFTVVNAVLLRPLPFPDPDRLVVLAGNSDPTSFQTVGYATFADYRDRTQAFEALAAIRMWQTTLVTSEAERLPGMRVSWNYFELLGVTPALGRTFRESDDHPDRYRVVVLSDGLWRRRFGADPSVIGRTLEMNDRAYEIIGVMPAGFDDVVSGQAYQPAELWAALGYEPSLPYACRSCQHLRAVGRLRPGVTVEQAAGDLSAIRSDLVRAYPSSYVEAPVRLSPLADVVAGDVRQPLFVLLAAVGFVLLIASANVAHLLLARAVNRTHELTVRAALGAGRPRLIRQMLTESALLWTLGGLAGVAIGFVLLEWLMSIAPGGMPRADAVRIDARVLLFAAGVTAVTGALFGLLPALSVTAVRARSLSAGASRGAVGASSRRARQALVVVDLAVALVLLAGAGLMFRTVSSLLRLDPGFERERVLTAQFSLIGEAYRDDSAVYAFIERVVERAGALPGVEAAAIAGQIPMGGNGDRFGTYIEGLQPANRAEAPSLERYSVTPEYFRVMQIPLRRGRLLDARDTPASEPVMLVSETAARTVFDGRDPIGMRARIGGAPDAPWRRIVGIVGDVRHEELTEEVRPQMYLPQSQFTDSFLVLVLKSATADLRGHVPAVRAALKEQDPSVPLYDVAPLETLLAKSIAGRRFVMQLLAGFAVVAVLLAAIGLYGVVSYTVSERTREVGLRVALGAGRGDILRLVLGSALKTAAAGLVIGLAAAAVLTRFLEGQLFGVAALDPGALGAAVAVLLIVAAAAHLVPVRRALSVDPTVALREE